MPDLGARPIYRHIVVQRKDLVEHIDVGQLQRLRRQQDAGLEIDADIQHLVVKDTLKKTVRKAMNWAGHGDVDVEATEDGLDVGAAFAEANLMKERGDKETLGYSPQEGVIVSRIIQDHIPGDLPGQAMPSNPSYLSHPGFESPENPQSDFMRCAQELHAQFQSFSDRKFLLMDKEMRAGVTLVTVVLTPIIAVPRADVGVELLCEFHQKSRFGFVDTEGFDVFSEVGEYPVQVPTDGDLRAMSQTLESFKAEEAVRRAQ